MYQTFKTDTDLETDGIWLDYGDFRVKIARSGGANKKFARMLEARTRPYQRAIKAGTLDNDVSNRIMRDLFIACVILDWNVKTEDGWVKGIAPLDDPAKIVPPSAQALAEVLEGLPDLFADIQEQAQSAANFRSEALEDNAGNS